jgi:CRISPR/Cas system CSM-associated protein Csm3 (group 7 of RAMP superfamily)
VIKVFNQTFNLQGETDFNAYLEFNPSFNSKLKFDNFAQAPIIDPSFTKYSLRLQPDSFFIFSEGFGDEEADNRPLEEEIVAYMNGNIEFEKQTVIPASSIKGAISHRVAFHYNRLNGQFADRGNGTVGVENPAVAELFGKAGQDAAKKAIEAQAGNVFINDFYYSEKHVANNKIFNHVAIDRFTGGALDSALFSEKVSHLLGNEFNFDVYVVYPKDNTSKAAKSEEEKLKETKIIEALECALTDVCKGLLPLGGMTTKGHGMFTGRLHRNEKELFNYENQNS